MLIGLCKDVGISEHITTIDITSIYSIKLTYDNKLTLELGDVTDAALKLTVAKNLIEKGEFDGEKGTLILSQLSENAYNMKVTFRPDYEDTRRRRNIIRTGSRSGRYYRSRRTCRIRVKNARYCGNFKALFKL